MLNENEWNSINDILLDLYAVSDKKLLSGKVLRDLKNSVPFTKGCFVLFDKDGKFDAKNSAFDGFDDLAARKYKEFLDSQRENPFFKDSEIEKHFLRATDIPFNAGIVLSSEGKISGILNLFRDAAAGDFSEKNIYVLNIMKRHLENILHNVCLMENQNFDFASSKCFAHAISDFALSHREAEILKLIADGKSNAEICNGLCVSISTVKKHVYNIFNKAGVNSRTQLLNQIYRMQKGS